MPVQPTYPGVYVEEIPSGVRTITGVSTSVAAFVGPAKRGLIDTAVHILSYADFERRFGGLDAASEMSYAVRQFFLNGGTDAWVVRLAKGAVAAFRQLLADTGNSLKLTAHEEGWSGNRIEVLVDHETINPASTFNLTLRYVSDDDPNNARIERFENLSMNSNDPRYVLNVVESQLVKIERNAVLPGATEKGASTSGEIDDVKSHLDSTHNRFFVSVNGLDPVLVQIDLADVMGNDSPPERLAALCAQIARKVQAQAGGRRPLAEFGCSPASGGIVMTSGEGGEASSVRVLFSPIDDASVPLRLGSLNGGEDRDAVAAIRPKEMPDPGTLTSGEITDLSDVGSGGTGSFLLGLDGGVPVPVNIGSGTPPIRPWRKNWTISPGASRPQ